MKEAKKQQLGGGFGIWQIIIVIIKHISTNSVKYIKEHKEKGIHRRECLFL
jgi:hypothetical protein